MNQLFSSMELFSIHHPSKLLGSSHSTKRLCKHVVPDVTRRQCSSGSGNGFLEVPPQLVCPEPALREQVPQQTWEQSTRAAITACFSLGRFCLSHQQSNWALKGGQMELLGQECQRKGGTSPSQPHITSRSPTENFLAAGQPWAHLSGGPHLSMRSAAPAALSAHKCGPSSGMDRGALHHLLPAPEQSGSCHHC